MKFFSINPVFFCKRHSFFACVLLCSLILFGTCLIPNEAQAWPTDAQWLELVKSGTAIQDSEADANGGVNVVPNDGSNSAAYIYNDGSYLYYRLRIDGDPTKGGNGIFAQFGWGFEIDLDQNAADYEWLIMCDGISQPEVVSLRENTDKTGLGDPSDKAEFVAAEYPLVGNHRLFQIQPTDRDYTATNGDPDYYLDFRMPYAIFKTATGITDNSLIRYFVGSSRSTNNLTENGADLVAGSDLYEMASDYITPFGTLPAGMTFYDGTVRFVEDLSGATDDDVAAPGDTVFLRVDDADQSSSTNPEGVIRVELSAPSGDTEVVILSATGVQGKYTGSITSAAAGASQNDGTLQISPDETVTVTYLDAVAANRSQNVPRTDTLLFATSNTDIEVTKTVDTNLAEELDPVTFTVTVVNRGPYPATGVVISDPQPAGLSFGAATPSQGGYAGGLWTVGALGVGASATLTIPATVNSGTNGTTLTNTAALNFIDQGDPNATNDTGSASVIVGGADLRVIKSVDNPYATEGDEVEYRVSVINLGPNPVTSLQLIDILPPGITYESDDSGGDYDPVSGIWTIGDLDVGDAETLEIGVLGTVPANTSGQVISNTAAVFNVDQPDPDPSNNSATVDLRVNFVNLELTKAVDVPVPQENDSIIFTLTLTNNGPNDASAVEVTDLLPSGVTYQSHVASHGSYTSGTGLWSIGDLLDAEVATLDITATVDAGTAGTTIINSAAVTNVDQTDEDPIDNLATATVNVDGTDMQVTKTVDNAIPGESDTVTYLITVTNLGPNPATGIAITDLLPVGVSGIKQGGSIQHTASQGSFDDDTGVWSVGNVAVAGTATLSIPVTVDAGTSGQTISNAAFITGADQLDPNNSNNTDSAEISVDGTDLVLTKTADNPTPDLGDTVTYTLTIENQGLINATGVIVNDLLPPEVTYLGDDSGGSYDNVSGDWTVGNLSSASTATLNITVQVGTGLSNAIITNTAFISAADQGDPNSNNDVASYTFVVSATDLSLAKTVDDATPAEGSLVTYTVTVSNIGGNDATGIEIDDLLPGGVTFVSSLPSQGLYGAGLWILGDLASSASATLQITATVDAGTAGSTITNTAALAGIDQIDTVAANNSASVDIIPEAPPALPLITFLKSSQVDNDPFNGAVNPKAIPGATVRYTLQAINFGTGSPDANTLVLTDPVPADTSLFVGDLGQGSPVFFTDIDSSGFVAGDVNTSYSSDADCSDYSYVPVPDTDGYDGNVCHVRVQMNGTFNAASGGTNPSFSLQFVVRIN